MRTPVRDLTGEALAGIVERPGRTALTALGTVLGVAAFVAVVGLTATAGGQISTRFNALMATEVTVSDASAAGAGAGAALAGSGTAGAEAAGPHENPFPADADTRITAVDGVLHGGVWWTVDDRGRHPVTGVTLPGTEDAASTPIVAASTGLLRAARAGVREGRLFDEAHDRRAEQVAVLGAAAAESLGVTSLAGMPAVLVDGVPFAVVGIVDRVDRQSDLLLSVVVPRRTAEALWGPPGVDGPAHMLVETRVGAAGVVASQLPLALRPDRPEAFTVVAPPEPTSLRDQVGSDLWVLFVLLAAVCLVIGAVGIANTTMVAVLERVPEIGLRRALGARRRHIAGQFLVESSAIGTAGGLVGASLGVMVVVGVSVARGWTPVLDPLAVLPAPSIGTVVGVLAGLYPASKAALIEPVEALRR